MTSNPRNPTGHVVANPDLAQIQNICRDRATLILDEFYGGYNYTSDCDGTTVSGAENVEDVNSDGLSSFDFQFENGNRSSSRFHILMLSDMQMSS